MAEDSDPESRTEAATDRRVREAIEKGDVPFSREAPTFAAILGLLVSLSLVVRGQAAQIARDLSALFDHPRGFALESAGDVQGLLQAVGLSAGRLLLPILLILSGFGLAASLLQNVPRMVGERIRPSRSRRPRKSSPPRSGTSSPNCASSGGLLVGWVRTERHANIADLVSSSAEPYFKEATLAYADAADMRLDWGRSLQVVLDMEFVTKPVTVFFKLVLDGYFVGVAIQRILAEHGPPLCLDRFARALSDARHLPARA